MWLPDTYLYVVDYWNWEGTGFALNTWVGEYDASTGKYFQYGQDIVINLATQTVVGVTIVAASLIANLI